MNTKVSYGALAPAMIGGLGVVVNALLAKARRGEAPASLRKLPDVIEFSDSGIWGDDSLDPDVEPRVFRVSDFDGDFRLDYSSAPPRAVTPDKLSKFRLRCGDILVVKSSGSAKQVVSGRVAVFDTEDKQVFAASNFLLRLRPKDDMDPHYLAFVLGSPPTREAVADSVKTMTYPNLSFRIYSMVEVPVIPLSDQKVVGAFFRALLKNKPLPDLPSYLAEQRRVVARVEELAAQIDEARTVRHQAAEEVDALVSTRSAELFRQASTHGTVALESIAILERGKFSHRPRNEPRFFGGEHPWIQIGEIESAGKHIREWTETLNDDGLAISKKFSKGTVLVSIAATIGAVGILDFDCCVPDSIVGVTPRNGTDSEFLYYFLGYLRKNLEKIAPQSAQKNINLRILAPLPVPKLTLAEQRQIVVELDALQAEVDALKRLQAETAAELDALLPAILDKAFKGEL
jgi:type I restriction enzyme, S subunit